MTEHCYICGSSAVKKYKKCNGYEILKCTSCGLLWVSNKIQDTLIQEFYSEDYFNSDDIWNSLLD